MSDTNADNAKKLSPLTSEELKKFAFYNLVCVEEEHDVVGFIAYALYKRGKTEFIEKYKRDNGGNDPSEDVLKTFQDAVCCESAVKDKRAHATNILKVALDRSIGDERDALQREKDIYANMVSVLPKVIQCPRNHTWPNFLSGCIQSVIGSIVFLVICVAIIHYYEKGPDILKFIQNKMFTTSTSSNGR